MKLRFTNSLSGLTLLLAGLVLISCGKNEDAKLSPQAANEKQIVGLWELTGSVQDLAGSTKPVAIDRNNPTVLRFDGKKANAVIFEGVTRPGTVSDVPAEYSIKDVTKLEVNEVTDTKTKKHAAHSYQILKLDPQTLVIREAAPGGVFHHTFTHTDVSAVEKLADAVGAKKVVNHK
jgi:hypothetical protein